jgi:hypothetical protein
MLDTALKRSMIMVNEEDARKSVSITNRNVFIIAKRAIGDCLIFFIPPRRRLASSLFRPRRSLR